MQGLLLLALCWCIVASKDGHCSQERCGFFCSPLKKCIPRADCAGLGRACVAALGGDEALKTYGRCAVVSSSDVLLGDSYGAEIDSYEAVFRINMSPAAGFETYVGSKTQVAVTNTPSWLHGNEFINSTRFARDLRKQKKVVVYVQDPLAASETTKCCYKRTQKRYRQLVQLALRRCKSAFAKSRSVSCRALDEHIIEVAWRATCGLRNTKCPVAPSSGLITILLARASCKSLRLFGFSDTSNKHLGHYYAPGRTVGPEFHPSLEHLILDAWNKKANNFSLAPSANMAFNSQRTTTPKKSGTTTTAPPNKSPTTIISEQSAFTHDTKKPSSEEDTKQLNKHQRFARSDVIQNADAFLSTLLLPPSSRHHENDRERRRRRRILFRR